MDELNSGAALVCRREVNCEHGGATVFYVLLHDGYLLDCGSSSLAEKRATVLAEIINEGGTEKLSREALSGPVPF